MLPHSFIRSKASFLNCFEHRCPRFCSTLQILSGKVCFIHLSYFGGSLKMGKSWFLEFSSDCKYFRIKSRFRCGRVAQLGEHLLCKLAFNSPKSLNRRLFTVQTPLQIGLLIGLQ